MTDYVHIWGMPNLTQFTVCLWMKSSDPNHGTLFSYAVPEQPNELLIIGYDSFDVWSGGQKKVRSITTVESRFFEPSVSLNSLFLETIFVFLGKYFSVILFLISRTNFRFPWIVLLCNFPPNFLNQFSFPLHSTSL